MTNKRPWRDEAAELLEAINSNFKAAEDQHKFTIRGLRERAAASERAVQQIADAIRYAADRAANSKEDTHD